MEISGSRAVIGVNGQVTSAVDKKYLITNAADGSQALVVDTGKIYILCDYQWREWTGSINAGTTIKWNNILEQKEE